MRLREKLIVVLAFPLSLAIACGQTNEVSDSMETKQTYSLCPKSDDARQRLYEQVRGFADQHRARFIDRGAGAQRELSQSGSDVLKRTGGEVILLMVEKSGEFRLSVTNLGLDEKIALAVRTWNAAGEDSAITSFLDDLRSFWTVQVVDGSVTNDPPC